MPISCLAEQSYLCQLSNLVRIGWLLMWFSCQIALVPFASATPGPFTRRGRLMLCSGDFRMIIYLVWEDEASLGFGYRLLY